MMNNYAYRDIKRRLKALENEEVEEIEDFREYYKEIYGEEYEADEELTSEVQN